MCFVCSEILFLSLFSVLFRSFLLPISLLDFSLIFYFLSLFVYFCLSISFRVTIIFTKQKQRKCHLAIHLSKHQQQLPIHLQQHHRLIQLMAIIPIRTAIVPQIITIQHFNLYEIMQKPWVIHLTIPCKCLP